MRSIVILAVALSLVACQEQSTYPARHAATVAAPAVRKADAPIETYQPVRSEENVVLRYVQRPSTSGKPCIVGLEVHYPRNWVIKDIDRRYEGASSASSMDLDMLFTAEGAVDVAVVVDKAFRSDIHPCMERERLTATISFHGSLPDKEVALKDAPVLD